MLIAYGSTLGVTGGSAGIFFSALSRDPLEVAARSKRLQGIFGQVARLAPLPNGGANILPKSAAQSFLCVHKGAILLQLCEAIVIHKRRAGVKQKGVEEAFVFGSWAARYLGEPGPAPKDVDVLVVGEASLRSVRHACSGVERDLRVDVNPIVVDHRRWSEPGPEPFISELKGRPLVPIPLDGPCPPRPKRGSPRR